MKLTRRRGQDEAAPLPDVPPPPPAPPRGSPVAAYAGILDGQTLWLAIEATPGTLALRDAAGEVHPLRSDLAEDDPAYRSVRADLLELPGDDEAAYDVVLVPASGRGPRPVWIGPFPKNPTRVPATRDRRFGLVRTEEGLLRVRRSRTEPGLDVLDLGVGEDGVRVTFEAGDATELRLVDGETVLAAYPLTRDGDRQVAVVNVAELPDGTGQLGQVLAGDLPLRRRANDLVNPHHAVLMPVLFGDDPDLPRLRLRWSPEGRLVARIVDRDDSERDG